MLSVGLIFLAFMLVVCVVAGVLALIMGDENTDDDDDKAGRG